MRGLRRTFFGGALLTLILTAVAVAQPPSGIVRPTTEPAHPSVRLGAELYAGNCASCHGIAGSGIEHPRRGAGNILGQGPPLRGVGAIAADFYLRTGYMPLTEPTDQPENNRVLFSNTEIKSLVAYVASLGPGPGIPDTGVHRVGGGRIAGPGTIANGLYEFTLHCAGCHQIVGRGGFVTGARVPPLQGLTPTEIAQAVRLGPYLMPRFSATQISNYQLASIVKYVLSTRDPVNRGGWGIGNLGPIPEGIVAWWIAIPLLLVLCRVLAKRFGS
jgi:ubiquinol-cytochrome c reductase cytochrome c subunit